MPHLRYGVIGTGMMGIEHIENINHLDGCAVTALSDPNPSSISTALAACAAPADVQTFADHRDLLASGCCDVVVIASPNHTHLGVATDVAATGRHVLIEKPMCRSVSESDQLLAALAASAHVNPKRQVWIGLEYRYMPPVAALISHVHGGIIGAPRMVAIREHRFPFLEKVDNWNRFRENTGGTLVEKCCHFFDLMCLIFGERPLSVMASGGQDVNHLDETYAGRNADILDNAYVIVDFADGKRAMLDLCMFAEATQNQEEIVVTGDLGKIEALVPEDVIRIGVRGRDGIGNVSTTPIAEASPVYQGLHHGSSFHEHVRFARAIRGHQPTEVTPDDGRWSVAIGQAAHLSIEESRPVQLKEIL